MASLLEHFVIASLIALLAYTNKEKLRTYWYTREDDALIGIDNAIGETSPHFKKVAVGVNANVDLIVGAMDVFENLGMTSSLVAMDHSIISSLEELDQCFSHHFSKCAAAERFVASKDLFDKIVSASRSLANAKHSVGGNSALMGLKMLYSSPNSSILLGGPVGPELGDLLDSRIYVPDTMLHAEDQYHIILEYRDGDKWGNIVSKCSNRFILTRDVPNGKMTAIEMFFDSLIKYEPDLVVVSGLHLLESQSEEFRKRRIFDLAVRLKSIHKHVPIHLELASMVQQDLIRSIAENVFPLVDSVGLNEQELAFLTVSLNGPHKTDGDLRQWPPEIGVMSDILYWALDTFGKGSKSHPNSRLTRIHFHSLTYHIIAVVKDYWLHSEAGAAAGSSSATRQACDHDDIRVDEVELRTPKYFARSVNYMPLRRNLVKHDEANPVTFWTHNKIEFYFSAVLVCKHPKRTVGLGDCISATGLQYSKFTPEGYLN